MRALMLWAVVLFAAAAVGCGGSPLPDLPQSAASSSNPTTLIRFPAQGGPPRLYRPGGLGEIEWRVPVGDLPPIALALGADLDQRLAFALGRNGSVVALDLESGRVRDVMAGVSSATLGPDGTLYTVDTAGAVSQVYRRRPELLDSALPTLPTALYGTRSRQLVAVFDRSDSAATLLGSQQSSQIPLVPGPTAATHWGDLIAVATDSGIVLYEPRATDPMGYIETDDPVTAVSFSPAGHRIYVIGPEDRVAVYDRYTERRLGSIRLPGRPAAIRSDPYGAWLLVHGAEADSVWIVDVGTDEVVATVASDWQEDLPTVIDGSVLIRAGDDVVALSVGPEGLVERGRVTGGSSDRFLAATWLPSGEERYAEQLAADQTSPSAVSGPQIYLQLSSSRNPAWATDLVNQMSAAGLPARMLQPGEGEEAYRVVLGPYTSREEAEEVARSLGRPSFIYQPRPADQAP